MTPDDPLPAWLPNTVADATRACSPIALVPADPDHGLDIPVVWQSVVPLVHENVGEELVTA